MSDVERKRLELSFGQVEAVCAALNHVANDKRVAFGGRLKQLQKQGLAEKGLRPGRGKAGTYSFCDLMRYVLALEFIQAGMMPQMAARLVNGSWDRLRVNLYACSFAPEETIGFTRKAEEYLWLVRPEALRALTHRGETAFDHVDRVSAVPIHQAAKELAKSTDSDPEQVGEGWRTLVINGYSLTQRVMRVVSFFFQYASRAAIRADIESEIVAYNEELWKFGEQLKALPNPSPEQTAAIMAGIARLAQTDFSTNPPRPRSVLVERADELIAFLPQHLKDVLSGPAPEPAALNDERKALMTELIDLNILTVEEMETDDLPDLPENMSGEGRIVLSVTHFGAVVIERLGGPWAEELADPKA